MPCETQLDLSKTAVNAPNGNLPDHTPVPVGLAGLKFCVFSKGTVRKPALGALTEILLPFWSIDPGDSYPDLPAVGDERDCIAISHANDLSKKHPCSGGKG